MVDGKKINLLAEDDSAGDRTVHITLSADITLQGEVSSVARDWDKNFLAIHLKYVFDVKGPQADMSLIIKTASPSKCRIYNTSTNELLHECLTASVDIGIEHPPFHECEALFVIPRHTDAFESFWSAVDLGTVINPIAKDKMTKNWLQCLADLRPTRRTAPNRTFTHFPFPVESPMLQVEVYHSTHNGEHTVFYTVREGKVIVYAAGTHVGNMNDQSKYRLIDYPPNSFFCEVGLKIAYIRPGPSGSLIVHLS